jgi:hypothetical protein
MLSTIRWLFVVGALIVWGLTDFVSTLATCQQEQQQKKQQNAEEGCGFAQSFTYRGIATSAEWIDTKHDFVTAAATLVVAFFTFTLWRATDRLWDAGERQLDHLNDTAERQLRAYITQVSSTLFDILAVPKVKIVLKNSGQTPAYDVVIWGMIFIGQFPPTEDMPWPSDPMVANDKTRSIVGPGETTIGYAMRNPLFDFEKVAIATGAAALYLYGKATYRDAFGRQRWTKFILFTSRETMLGEEEGRMTTFQHEAT